MDTLLHGIPGVCVYIDDILISGRSEEEHLAHLSEVLKRLADSGMRLKREKCSFLLSSVEYLGHVISAEGLKTSDSKVKAVSNAPVPTNVRELRSFLGLVNYYGKFLPDLATTLSPLYILLQRNKRWSWQKPQEEAFRHVKELLKSNRVLTHFNDSLPLVLSCDASPYGVGAVLVHRFPNGDERPVARTLSIAEKKYSQLDKEALAIVFGVKRFHQYLYGRSFELKTDHKPLIHIFNEKKGIPVLASSRIQRWALTLGAHSYTIHYQKGKENVCADAMSRLPVKTQVINPPKAIELIHLMEYLNTTPTTCTQIRRWTDHDPVMSRVREWILTGWPEKGVSDSHYQPFERRKTELSTENGCILWGNRVVIPVKGRKSILSMLHEGHTGIVRMKSFARHYVWWPGMDQEIEQCVKSCNICQLQRKTPPVVPLHPWSWPNKPWSRIHIDYAGPVEGKMFLVIVDAHSKWMEIHITSSTTTTATVELLRKSFASLGLPEVLVSDNATNFTSEEFGIFMKKNGIRHVRTPPYHPASNGLAKRAVQTLKDSLRKIKTGSLETRLSRFLFKYRNTPHTVTGLTPAEVIFGRRLRTYLDNLKPDIERRAYYKQDCQRQWYNIHTKQRKFISGDLVFVRNYSTGTKWLPGKVLESHGDVMFTIELEDGRKVRKHTDQLISRQVDFNAGEEQSVEEDSPLIRADDVEDLVVTSSLPSSSGIQSEGIQLEDTDPNDTDDNSATDSRTSPHSPRPSQLNQSVDTNSREGLSSETVPLTGPRRSTRTRRPPNRYDSDPMYQ